MHLPSPPPHPSQAIMLDIVVMLFHILRAYLPAEVKWSILSQYFDMFGWTCCMGTVVYCVFWTLRWGAGGGGEGGVWSGVGGSVVGALNDIKNWILSCIDRSTHREGCWIGLAGVGREWVLRTLCVYVWGGEGGVPCPAALQLRRP
jgi:hypothetical protein